MTESEMEDLLWEHSEKLLGEQLTKYKRQQSSAVGRSDLIFKDSIGRFLIVEIKRGTLRRGAIPQLLDYYGMMKERFPGEVVELMVVANEIPKERRLACELYNIEPREISAKRFRDLANEVNYIFKSEVSLQKAPIEDTSPPFQCPKSKLKEPTDVPSGQQNKLKDDVTIEITRGGNKIFKTKSGLLPDTYWRDDLRNCPTELLCRIRQSLLKSIPQLGEKVTASGQRFGYFRGHDKDRAYIYVRKKDLRIDLCISREHEKDLQNQGYIVKYQHNFQGRASWLTGWQVPHSAEDVQQIVNWICKALSPA